MDRPPRPPDEPIINRFMAKGIIIQTVAITVVTLTAYLAGLVYYSNQPDVATTMAFVTLSFSELLRAFTARSERYPLYKIGVFTNKYMNLAFVTSLVLLLVVVYIPFLQPIFNTTALGWEHWRIIIPLLFIPALAAEIGKFITTRREMV